VVRFRSRFAWREIETNWIATQGEWEQVGGGVPVGGFADNDFGAHAVLDSDATGATAAGTSFQRLDDGDDNDKADWTDANVGSWGANNTGQSDI